MIKSIPKVFKKFPTIYLLKYGFEHRGRQVVYIGATRSEFSHRYERHKEQVITSKSPHSRVMQASLSANREITMEKIDFQTEVQAIYHYYEDKNYLITNLSVNRGSMPYDYIEQRTSWRSAKNFKDEFELLDKLLEIDTNYGVE